MRCLRHRSLTRLAALIAAVLGLLALAAVAHGRTETGSFVITETFSDVVDDSGTCLGPGATGTIAGTATVVGHFTETGPPALKFQVHGTNTATYRVDYADGRYILGSSLTHFSENANAPQFSNHEVTRDQGTLYAATGQPLGRVIIHAVSQITFRDANGNFQPDPGEIKANVDHVRVTCR
jgi:hypothetical protein